VVKPRVSVEIVSSCGVREERGRSHLARAEEVGAALHRHDGAGVPGGDIGAEVEGEDAWCVSCRMTKFTWRLWSRCHRREWLVERVRRLVLEVVRAPPVGEGGLDARAVPRALGQHAVDEEGRALACAPHEDAVRAAGRRYLLALAGLAHGAVGAARAGLHDAARGQQVVGADGGVEPAERVDAVR
jgi:hypothetical protein